MRDIVDIMKEWNKKRVETNKEIKDMTRIVSNTLKDYTKTCSTMVDNIQRCYKAVVGDKCNDELSTFGEDDDDTIENDKFSYIFTIIEKQAYIS